MPNAKLPDSFNPSERRRELFWRFVKIGAEDDCWPWQLTLNEKGYGLTTVDGWKTTAHRMALALTIGLPPPDTVTLHSCDNPPCCNPRHLSNGTQAKNLEDMRSKGRGFIFRVMRGEAHPRSKLTDPEVAEIRASIGATQTELATKYGVSQGHIGKILRGDYRQLEAA